MTNIIVRDKPAANSVFESSNCKVISVIISNVIVGKYVFVRWYEIILFSFMSTCSIESFSFVLNVVSKTLNCERVLGPVYDKLSGKRAMLPIKSFGRFS